MAKGLGGSLYIVKSHISGVLVMGWFPLAHRIPVHSQEEGPGSGNVGTISIAEESDPEETTGQ